MSVYRRPGSKSYSYDFRWRGHRFSGATGCTNRREAEKVEDEIKRQTKAKTIDLAKPMTFGTASTMYWNEVGQFHARPTETERFLAWLQVHVGNTTIVSDVSGAMVARLVAERRSENVSNATVNRSVLEPLRAIHRRCERVWEQKTQHIEWKDHFLQEAQERVREATPDEENKIINSLRADYVRPVLFAVLTGCRRAETVGLTWDKVDFFNRRFSVTGKGKRSRTIPMSDMVYELLWSCKDDHKTAVFTYVCRRPDQAHVPGARRGQRIPITLEGFKTAWRRRRKLGHIKDFKFHDTRHTAATRLLRATGNLKLAQRLLGHTEIATTARYAHVTDADLLNGLQAAESAREAKTPTRTPTGIDSLKV